jgi:lipid-A-disaccharide synthase
MKYYIIAGEASGDLHGSNLIRELKKLDQRAEVRAWGGDLMKAAGASVVKHYKELAFMGFAEVIRNLPTILHNLKFCKKDILQSNPDVLVLIDYPGFNLRIAKWASTQGYKIVYYISPQVWAWKENRIRSIKKFVDKMLVILPFEKEFYEKRAYAVEYVGHPLVEVINDFLEKHPKKETSGKKIIALLPGSREQEVAKKLPVMLEASKNFPEYQFVVAKAASLSDAFYASFLQGYPEVNSVQNQTYALLSRSTAALVTSGTATLETALLGVPEIVCYKGSPVSYAIAKRVVKIKYISLVNLIMDKEVVKELIQHDLTAANITSELNSLLYDENKREQIKKDYAALKNLLLQETGASAKAAKKIIDLLSTSAGKA